MKSNAAMDVAAIDGIATGAKEAVRHGIDLVGHVQVGLAAQVGTISVSIQRLFDLKAGDVISMNETLEAPITLMLNGRAIARAELLAVDDHFGVRILELA